MEKQRLEACLDMRGQDATSFGKERTLTLILILIYRVHTLNHMLFCVDTGAPFSFIGSQELERIVHLAGRDSIPMIESDRNLQFGTKI